MARGCRCPTCVQTEISLVMNQIENADIVFEMTAETIAKKRKKIDQHIAPSEDLLCDRDDTPLR